MKKTKKEQGGDLQKRILRHLRQKSVGPVTLPELLQALHLPKEEERSLRATLNRLMQQGEVARIKGRRFIVPEEADLIPGRIQITRHGRGYLLPDEPSLAEVRVPASATGTALHDDHVLVRLDRSLPGAVKGDEASTGAVVRVLERRRRQIVGTLKRSERFLYVVPDDPRLVHDINVPEPRDLGRPAREGDKVVVEMSEWTSKHTNPEGVVVEVLGPPSEEGVDMLAILRHYELPLRFPRKVLAEARKLGREVKEQDLQQREDCRDHRVVTIDPEDAKDFDDAFSLERLRSNRWKLRVHIADVSHYVKPGSALDEEARRRGNSTYLVDRVIPMLPEALSNEACSLKPGVERLTKCVEFLLEDDGRVIRARPCAAVILSQRRFTYAEALQVLEKPPSRDPIERMLHDAGRLAQRLRRRRFADGALALDFPEVSLHLDSHGKVDRIEVEESDAAHQLIEEFMLLANEAVARRLNRQRRPSLHRVHEAPDRERLQAYREEVTALGIPCGDLEKPEEVRKLLRRLDAEPIGRALKIGFLKSLSRARYAVEPLGHYGLAKEHYAHFTSPIRRYADLLVHRALFESPAPASSLLHSAARHLSATERNSADAERDSRQVKLFAFLKAQMKRKQRTAYRALVTEIRNFGFFVDVTGLGMSGLVPLSELRDDFYEFEPARGCLRGRRTKHVIRLGEELMVEVAKVDDFKRQADFRLASQGARKGKRPSKKRSRIKGERREATSSQPSKPGAKGKHGEGKRSETKRGEGERGEGERGGGKRGGGKRGGGKRGGGKRGGGKRKAPRRRKSRS